MVIYMIFWEKNLCLHTHLINFVSFHFIRLCDGASGVVGRQPYYSQTFNKGASSHLIPTGVQKWVELDRCKTFMMLLYGTVESILWKGASFHQNYC